MEATAGAVLVVLGVVVLAGLLVASFFVSRYRESTRAQQSWTRTDEVFNDPSTQRVMRVWLDDKGGRHYVEDGPGTGV